MPSPIPPTTPEAASTQRSPAANTGTPDIPVPDHGADLEPQPHNTLPPPNEGAETPIHHLPQQIQAPIEVEGPLLGKESQRVMGQRGLTSAHTLEGNMPIGEAHGRPPNFANPQTQGSTAWEPASVVPKARVRVHKVQRPVLDEGAHTRPDPWPNLGAVIVDPDIYFGSASQLEGEQNFHLPCVGSELHAAPSPPQNFPSSFSPFPPPDTPAHENPSHGEGAATERRVIEDHPRPGPRKPPDLHAEDLQETRGALSALGNIPVILEGPDPLGLVGTVVDVDVREVEPSGINARERGGASPVVGTTPALAEETAGVGPAGEAETANTTRPEALVPWAQDKTGRGREVNKPPHEALPQKGERNVEALSRKRERHPNKGALALWDLGGRPPRERTLDSKRPIEAIDTAPGIVAHKKNPGCAEVESVKQHHPEQSTTHLGPISHHSIHCPGLLSSRSPSVFVSRSIERAQRRSGRYRGNNVATWHRNAAAVTPASHAVTRIPAPCTHWCTGRRNSTRGHKPLNTTLARPQFLLGGISPQFPDCLRNEGECSKRHADQITRTVPHGHSQ